MWRRGSNRRSWSSLFIKRISMWVRCGALPQDFWDDVVCFNTLPTFSTGDLCALAEGEFHSGVHCLDSLKSIESFCGISTQVSLNTGNPFLSLLMNSWCILMGLLVMSLDRYGLPVNYQALLLETDRKRSKKLKEELSSLFVHLDPTASMKEVRKLTLPLNISSFFLS